MGAHLDLSDELIATCLLFQWSNVVAIVFAANVPDLFINWPNMLRI